MQEIRGIEFHAGSREELLPGFTAEFPYIASHVELDARTGWFVTWHWHKTVELFYIESGTLEYFTPRGKWVFPAGSGGLVNANVLHTTRPQPERGKTVQLLHIFDPAFLAGGHGSRIEQKYILPMLADPQLDLLALYPDDPEEGRILDRIRAAFALPEEEAGYELRLRGALSEIWLALFLRARPQPDSRARGDRAGAALKQMMSYLYEHYAEKLSVAQLAAAAFLSERECFRLFREALHTTPAEYLRDYRLQRACQMLAEGQDSVSAIGYACGLGSSSSFGRVFRQQLGCTPLEYRRRWQNQGRNGQESDSAPGAARGIIKSAEAEKKAGAGTPAPEQGG